MWGIAGASLGIRWAVRDCEKEEMHFRIEPHSLALFPYCPYCAVIDAN